LNTRAISVRMADKDTIASVIAMDVHTGERTEFAGALFADCTGDGWIGFWAGADFREGREARREFNEPLAPPKADKKGMSSSLYNARIVDRDGPVEFEGPAWAYSWESPEDFEGNPMGAIHTPGDQPPVSFGDLSRGGGRRPSDPLGAVRHTWWVEIGGIYDRITDAEMIRDELFRVHVGLWDYAKNHDPKNADANRNRELVWINHIAGKRESRRLMGDYILTQKDYQEKTVHPDSVAYGGWSIDVHHPQGFWTPGNQYYHAYFQKISIPLRSLYSRNVSNLFMAGRDISVSHVALGGVRVMRTTALMGQAVGTAAAVANEHGATPRGVYNKHLAELQQSLLRDGAYVMGVPNQDANDLALGATVTASSVAQVDDPATAEKLPNQGTVHDLTTSRAFMFTAEHDRLDAVDLYLRNETPTPVELTLRLRKAKKLGEFRSTDDIATATGTAPTHSAGWVSFGLSADLRPGDIYWAWLPAAPGLKWELYEYFPEGTWRAYGGPNWTPMSHCYRHRLHPGGESAPPGGWERPGQVDLAPDSVVDGWNRAVHGTPHSWGPDPEEAPPHWIELDLGGPRTFDTLHITFQTEQMAASFYNIAVPGGDEWRRIATIEDNALRRRVHEFEPVTTDRVRITFTGAPRSNQPMRACEVRLYRA
ncbi:MAG TPA: FAD-dependent oxidoreductase, partial [Armatimonadota bacterium]|nr:FAD-dependent oxidoreductase [Armatimonadota bacterium]